MSKLTPIAWLRDAQPDAEDEALVVCAKDDPGAFPVYAVNSHPALVEALRAALEWIDAVPADVVLPAMPGFDRDEVNDLLARAALTEAGE